MINTLQKTLKEEEACKYRVDFLTGQTYPCDYVAFVKEGVELNFYKPYEVKVQGLNDKGIGPDIEPVVIMSAEDCKFEEDIFFFASSTLYALVMSLKVLQFYVGLYKR